jgi:hemerythrin
MKKAPIKELEAKLDEYLEHVQKHFSNEEELMEKYQYPEYEMHKMAHDMFLADLKYATNHWKSHGDINKMINFIRKTPEWLIMHINGLDTDTASFLAFKTEKEN